jgi:ABC-type lipoprotein export system ATPase subunit
MNTAATPILELEGIEKRYQGLRPLRLQSLAIAPGERVAVLGLDAAEAEVLVNLVTGASVADRGVVRVLGRDNAQISDGDDWLASLDRFGIVSPRAVLLEGATLEQNLAMPFTLQIDPVEPETARRVAALAEACGLGDGEGDAATLRKLAGEISPEQRARAHLARAIALGPALLVLEHPTADLPAAAVRAYGTNIVSVAEARGQAMLVLTQDQGFAQQVAHRALKWNPATGGLTPVRRGWFS